MVPKETSIQETIVVTDFLIDEQAEVVWTSQSGSATVKIRSGYVHVNDEYVHLTKKELCLCMFIISGKGEVRTKAMVLSELYPLKRQPEQKIIDIFICKIRKKLAEKHPDAEGMIKTVWGRGYTLSTSPENTDRRWVASVKAEILELISSGKKSVEEILSEYPQVTAKELSEWQALWEKDRLAGLKVTRTQQYM